MQRVHVLSAFVFCLCLATVNAQSNYKYNVNVYLSAEYFEPVDGDIELRFVKNDLFESFVTETKHRLEPNGIISFTLESDSRIEDITAIEFSWKLSLFRPLRHWLRKPSITVQMIQLSPLYIQDSFNRQMRTKHLEGEFGAVRALPGEKYTFSRLINNEFLP